MYQSQMFEELPPAMPLNEEELVSGHQGNKLSSSFQCRVEPTVLSGQEAAIPHPAQAKTWKSEAPFWSLP